MLTCHMAEFSNRKVSSSDRNSHERLFPPPRIRESNFFFLTSASSTLMAKGVFGGSLKGVDGFGKVLRLFYIGERTIL